MTKGELIAALQALKCPDETPVASASAADPAARLGWVVYAKASGPASVVVVWA